MGSINNVNGGNVNLLEELFQGLEQLFTGGNAPKTVETELFKQPATNNSTTAFQERQGVNGANLRQANILAAAPRNASFNYNGIEGLRNNPNVTPAFLNKVEGMAQRLGTRPEYLLAVMSFETGGSFSPSIQNGIGATGLIQFLRGTAEGLGTTTSELRQMSPTQQLDYVEKYFAQPQYRGKLGTLEGVYTAVLSGTARQNPNDTLFTRGTRAYEQNPLDWNRDGKITGAEATTPVAARMYGGVRAVQQKLVDLGFVPQNRQARFADGQWGGNTASALSDFQRSRGLTPTGNMDDATGRALFNITTTPNQPTTTTPTPNQPTTPTRPTNPSSTIPRAGLERGNRGAEVEKLQENLIKLGHLSRKDQQTGVGTFGPRTQAALKDFQRQNNLSPSGKFDNATRKAMTDINSGIKRGNTTDKNVIKGVQDELVKLGYMSRAQVNTGYGTFGPKTEAAVKKFQADHKIQQTGIVGAQTYKAMQNATPRTANPTTPNPTTPNGGGTSDHSVATDGRHFTVERGILMTNELRPRLESVANAYFARTGQNLHVTSGYRPPARQASAMYDLIQRHGAAYVQGLYANKGAVGEIIRAYNNGGGGNNSINAMTRVIENQVGRGTYVSDHLRSRALDISTGANLSVLRDVVRQAGGSVLNEGDHYHVEL